MQQNIHENEQVLKQIEWNLIRNDIENISHFKTTPDRVLSYLEASEKIQEKLSYTKIFEDLNYLDEYRSLINDFYSIWPDFEFKEKILQATKHKALALEELNQLAIVLESYFNHFKFINTYFNWQFSYDDFYKFKREIEKSFLANFRKFVSAEGEIDLSKHPLIRPLYEKQLALEAKIRSLITQTLHSGELKDKIAFQTIDIINDRYVIALRSDSYSSKYGQIVSRSDSGNTLYIEPSAISMLNFNRIEILIQIQEILSKLELDLTKTLAKIAPILFEISDLILHCDEFNTRVRFAGKYQLSFPVLAEHKKISLKKFFHPLIANPVKNDLKLENDKLGLVISGPNTGGKTATLKVIALTQLFLRYGLFIPAHHGEVYLYDKVFYFGNDQQNLNQGLSSFSAEVQNYSQLFDSFGKSNLILIDEIFNSTSSEEASALAIAFFKEIQKLTDVHIVVSSHHQTLKTILHQDSNYLSAHVGFDAENNRPTYRLHFGTPGSSHALKIFRSLTHNREYFENIYKNSLQFLDNKVIHYEKLLDSIAQKENALQKVLTENQDLNKQLKNQKQSMEGVIKLKIQERVQKAESKLLQIQKKAESLLENIKKGEISKTKQIHNKISELKSESHKLAPLKEDPQIKTYENLSLPNELYEGHEYFCLSLQKTVRLKRIEKNKRYSQVVAGKISMKVETNSLRLANKPKQIIREQISHSYTTSRNVKLEYDCRGMRLEEFQSLIEDVTSDLLLGEIPYISIIHGHGTGVLKNWLREYIKKSKDLTTMKDETGNDGSTRFCLI